MLLEREQDIRRGMRVTAELPDIMPDQADARTKPIYEDIQHSLRVPFVNLIFRTLANFPDYLAPAWHHVRPVVRMRPFEEAADGLRAEALLGSAPTGPEPNWVRIENLDRLRAFNDTIHYVLPKLLLITTMLDEASAASADQDGSGGQIAEIPLGIADGAIKVQMLDPGSGRVGDLFHRIMVRHGHPLVPSYYRGLGNWPEFLAIAWDRIEPLVGSEIYEQQKSRLVEHARAATLRLPMVQDTCAVPTQNDQISAILAAFRFKFIPEMMIDAAWITAMIDGPPAANSSRFSTSGSVPPSH